MCRVKIEVEERDDLNVILLLRCCSSGKSSWGAHEYIIGSGGQHFVYPLLTSCLKHDQYERFIGVVDLNLVLLPGFVTV